MLHGITMGRRARRGAEVDAQRRSARGGLQNGGANTGCKDRLCSEGVARQGCNTELQCEGVRGGVQKWMHKGGAQRGVAKWWCKRGVQ